jgi:ABC-type Fe3+/spermidine/putrescine transport system ATPase subunit
VSGAVPAIRLAGVTKRYGTAPALLETDLEIAEGEFFCLLGPSGCGKTTTLNLIGGFVNPSSGEIYIREKRVDTMPPYRRSVNTVFQSYALFPHMTVRENIGFGLRMARVPKAESKGRIEEALGLVGLEEHGERFPGQLSGGQQQRVAVARALISEPEVVLADEPIAEVDTENADLILEALWEVIRRGGAVLAATHNPEALRYSSRVILFRDGKIEAEGRPEEISARLTVD